jgi:tRNA(Ile)-lysidine synthase TilS/MesJ
MSDVKGREAVWLVRPMLTEGAEVDRAACRRICELAGVEWAEDLTNGDMTRLRAAVRGRVGPVLKELRPDVGRRVMAVAGMAEVAGKRLERAARRVIRSGKWEAGSGKWEEVVWGRAELRKRDVLVLGAVVREVRRKLCGRVGEDGVSKRAVDAVVRAVRDGSTEVRRCVVGGMEVEVTARRVVMRRRHEA